MIKDGDATRLRGMDLRRLQVLARVAELGSFSAAADELNYTPSAVSQQMGQLEAELGAQLLRRHSRGVQLTEAGRILLEHSEKALGHLSRAQWALAAHAERGRGRLGVALGGPCTSPMLATALRSFVRSHGEVDVLLDQCAEEQAAAAVRTLEADVAILAVPSGGAAGPAFVRGLDVTFLCREPLLAVVAARHPAAGRMAVELEALAGDPWILPKGYQRIVEALGVSPRRLAVGASVDLALPLIANGAAVGLLPDGRSVRSATDVVARPVAGAPLAQDLLLLTSSEGPPSQAAVALVSELVEAAGAAPRRGLAVA